jgi:NAD+ synthase (glutamine-hydrolysing)
MRFIRLALAQLNPTVGDLAGNFDRIATSLAQARELGVDIIAFPEMMITGYPPEDLLLKPSFIETAIERTHALLPLTAGLTAVVGTVERDFDLYNAAAVLHDGQWIGAYRKRYLPNYGVFDENRYFMPGTRNPVFVRANTVFGVNICEDIWYPGGPVEEQVMRGGADILINVSASPYHAGKAQARRRMLCTRAADNLAIVCYVNLVGAQDEIIYDGCSLIVDEQGQVLAEGKMFEEDLVIADIDLESVFSARLHDPRLRKGRALEVGESSPRIDLPMTPNIGVGASNPVPEGGGVATAVRAKPALEARSAPLGRELMAEIYDALVLGTRDYVRKNDFESVALGLSGGIDSSLCACVAVDALGSKQVIGVSMPSVYTSPASLEDASTLARTLGIRFLTLPISDVFNAYLQSLATAFAGREPDTTEENIQARIRGNYLMGLSNKFGWMVLTTGNKSEISVGYTTLYGDSAGGFAILKDVYKTMVVQLARYRNGRSGFSVIPERVLTRSPSAELRANQTDQDSLPPYEQLDPILKLYVEEDRSVQEVAELGYDTEVVRHVVRLVDRAEYKRRQSPPGIKITPRAFGKDRRLPITNRWRG